VCVCVLQVAIKNHSLRAVKILWKTSIVLDTVQITSDHSSEEILLVIVYIVDRVIEKICFKLSF